MEVTLAGREHSLRRAYDRLAVRPAWAACALLVVLSGLTWLTGFEPGPVLRYGPLTLSILLFGLPHGAVDHLVPVRLGAASLAVSFSMVGIGYLLLGGLYAGLWVIAPGPAALLFVGLTWFHWGQGDLHALLAFVGADHLRTLPMRGATLSVRGGLPMLVPLLAFPERYRAVIDAWVGLFGRELRFNWLFAVETRLMLGVAFLAVTVFTLAAGYRMAGDTRGWRVDTFETALLWVYFLTVPPLVAIGVYFCLWHSLRHIVRLASLTDGAGSPVTLLGSFARDAAPLTALSLVLLVGFGFVVPLRPSDLSGFVAFYLVFIAVVTLPHVVVVSWMDRRDGIWVP